MMNAYFTRAAAALVLISSAACTTQNKSAVVDATTTPLSDLNLVRVEIPAVLVEAQKAPYGVPREYSCTTLDSGIHEFDEVLGSDLDAAPAANTPGLIERGSNAAGTATVGALKRTAEGIVPFRGWVRKLSGAERYSNKVAAAITAGQVRRAFLKGLRASMQCGLQSNLATTAASGSPELK